MGFLDFLKGKKEKAVEAEKLSFDEVSDWIENKDDILNKERKIFLESMKDRVSSLAVKIGQGTESLKNINWEKIKAEDRIKSVVKENLEKYRLHLEKLGSDLEDLKKEEVPEKIDMTFSDFNKRAGMNYQKATFLIGRELELIQDFFGKFFRDLEKIRKDNSPLIEKIRIISNLKEKLRELRKLGETRLNVDNEIKEIDKEIEKLNNEIKNSEKEIYEIKKSAKYLKEKTKREELENTKEKLKKKMQGLRSAIHFKTLARIWHENEKEMGIIKEYNKNFQEAFQKDKGEILKKLINSLENKKSLNKELLETTELEREIKSVNLGVSLTQEFEEKIKKTLTSIKNLDEKKSKEEKKIEKLSVEKQKIIERIKSELTEFGVEISEKI